MISLMITMVILLVAGFAFFMYVRYLYSHQEISTPDSEYTTKYLEAQCALMYRENNRQNLKARNLTRQEYDNAKRIKQEQRKAKRDARQGNKQAKRYVEIMYSDMVQSQCDISAATIDKVINFNHADALSVIDKFEILVYIFNRRCETSEHTENPANGFSNMIKEFDLANPHMNEETEEEEYYIDDADIERVYDIVMNTGYVSSHSFDSNGNPISYEPETLDYDDKLEIVTQRLFENIDGYGVADLLINSTIDEIDLGVNGIGFDAFEITQENFKELPYTYESVWIMYHGLNLHMRCLSFGSQEELVRVINNVCAYQAPNPLAKNIGNVITTMRNGSRVLAVRGPMANSYAAFIRKFDSAPSIAPEQLFKDTGAEDMIMIMKWFIRGELNIAVTGQMGTGKTTTLKSFVKFIPQDYTIRLQEKQSELNLQYAYPNRSIVNFQETDHISGQEELNLIKKSNGTITIIGEVADAIAASWAMQVGKVASRYLWFTHHAKTTVDLIEAIRDNLLQSGGYSNEKAAERLVASVINIDAHMEKLGTKRFMQKITEVVPIRDDSYPSEREANKELAMEQKLTMDTMEYMKRETDRHLFTTNLIFEYVDNAYVLRNMPTQSLLNEIRNNLRTDEMKEEFDTDMMALESKLAQRVA